MENLIIVAVINKDKQYLVTVGENKICKGDWGTRLQENP